MKFMTSLATATPSQMALSSYLQTEGYDRHLSNMRLLLERNATLALPCIFREFPKGTKVTRDHLAAIFCGLSLPKRSMQ